MPLGRTTALDRIYPPLNTLKPVSENIWLVDGPLFTLGRRC